MIIYGIFDKWGNLKDVKTTKKSARTSIRWTYDRHNYEVRPLTVTEIGRR